MSGTLTFQPDNRSVDVCPGDTVLDAALDEGIDLLHDCGGNCACTTCHIVVEAGLENLSQMEQVEQERLASAEALTSRSRLGCQAILRGGDVTVRIVEAALQAGE